MIVTIVILSVLLVLALGALWLSLTLNKRLSAFAVRFEENYGTAQDILEAMYRNLDDVLQRPVLVDDPVTVRVLAQIKSCRSEVLRCARLISMQNDDEKEEDTTTR